MVDTSLLVALAPLILLLTPFVKKLVDFVKQLQAGDYRAAGTQLLAWAVGIGIVMLDALNGGASDALNIWAQILAGLTLGSLGSTLHDTLEAIEQRRANRDYTVPTNEV